jgi:hypothetical protein
MFEVDLLGVCTAVVIGAVHLTAQLRSEEESLNSRGPLLTSILITAVMGFNEAFKGVIGGDSVAWRDGAATTFFLFPFILTASLAGSAAGRMLQRL